MMLVSSFMFQILNKQILASDVKRMDIFAPAVASKARPGQFVSVCPEEGYERIPLSIAEFDPQKGTISLIVHEVGETTRKLGSMAIKESVFSILGPLGVPATIAKWGNVVCVSSGIGTAQMLPIARALKKAGNKVFGIIGTKTKRSLMLESQMRLCCERLFIATEDGSYEQRGLATDALKKVMNQHSIQKIYAIGSVEMMRSSCGIAQLKNLDIFVYLHPVMVDCMGMCGSCRVKVGGKIVLACIEGQEFNGHQVDFEDYQIRLQAYKESQVWRNQAFPSSPRTSESKALPRFLSAILRK